MNFEVAYFVGHVHATARNSRGRPKNAPAAFSPTVPKRPPRGPGWVHELKHDGYRLQIHIRDGRVRLYTAADWSQRYPLIVEDSARIKGTAILDAEVVCVRPDGVADFDRLHGRCFDHLAVACAFDLLMLNGDDLRRKTFAERETALRKLLKNEPNGIQYVEHIEGDGDAMFDAVCKLGLEGIVSEVIRPLSLRAVEKLDQDQEPEGPGSNKNNRWNVLARAQARFPLRPSNRHTGTSVSEVR